MWNALPGRPLYTNTELSNVYTHGTLQCFSISQWPNANKAKQNPKWAAAKKKRGKGGRGLKLRQLVKKKKKVKASMPDNLKAWAKTDPLFLSPSLKKIGRCPALLS